MLKPSLYLMCLAAGGAGAWLIAHFGDAIGLLDKPNDRSSHSSLIPKGGGIGILAAFLFVSVWEGLPSLWWIPAGALAIFSLIGDRIEMSPNLRLISQFVAAWAFLFSLDLHLGDPIEGIVLVFAFSIFMAGTANCYNFMDGINGIAGITGLVGFSLLGGVAYAGDYEVKEAMVPICIALACAGFLPFNMPKARVFMGDVGSILLGFVFAQMIIMLSRDALDFICFASFLFPFYADEFNTMIVRIRNGENLLKAHHRHIYQLLANEKGIAHWKVSFGYGLCQAVVGGSILSIKPLGLIPVILVLTSWFSVSFVFGFLVRRSVPGST